MRVLAFDCTMSRRIPTLSRLRAAPSRRGHRSTDQSPEPSAAAAADAAPDPDPDPAPDGAVRAPSTPEERVRLAGGPQDRAHYTCSCGMVFRAPVSASVTCPHCGAVQDW